MTGKGWVQAGYASTEVGEQGAGPEGRDTKSSGRKVSDGDSDEVVGARLSAETVWEVSCYKVSTRLGTILVEEDNYLNYLY